MNLVKAIMYDILKLEYYFIVTFMVDIENIRICRVFCGIGIFLASHFQFEYNCVLWGSFCII